MLRAARSGSLSFDAGQTSATFVVPIVAGTDYLSAAGTLTFAASQTSASFAASILADGTAEATKALTLRLSNPTDGLTLGTRATARLWIVDPSSPAAAAVQTSP
jgi:hypothetical protein